VDIGITSLASHKVFSVVLLGKGTVITAMLPTPKHTPRTPKVEVLCFDVDERGNELDGVGSESTLVKIE
jgi:hypothetical protein